MSRGDLVPIRRAVVCAPEHVKSAVRRLGNYGTVVKIEEARPYNPGDAEVHMVVTTLEPPKRRHPWHLYLLALAAVLVAAAFAWVFVQDPGLVIAGIALTTLIFCGFTQAVNDHRGKP